jgi:multiple sugar transport system substrate-binding protein
VEEEAEGSEDRFLNGRLAMLLNSRRGVPTYREVEGFDWDVAALPQGVQRAGILHSDAYCVPAGADNLDAIWAFVEYANSPAGQTLVAASGRTVPSLRAIAESPAFLDPNAKPANSQVFLSTIPVIRRVPIMDTWVDIEEIAGQEVERAFYGEATLDEAIEAAISRTHAFFAP